jgi:phospholipid-translocating ATPase
VETAINIGFACNLLKRNMVLIVVQAHSSEDTMFQLKQALCRFWDESGQALERNGHALIIDGETLKFALSDESRSLLLELGCRCKSVVCCRVSPLQKAMVVQLVRQGLVPSLQGYRMYTY